MFGFLSSSKSPRTENSPEGVEGAAEAANDA